MKVAILTPLALEYQSIVNYLKELQTINVMGQAYTKGEFQGNCHKFEVLLCQAGVGNKTIAIATERVIQFFKPSLIFLVGVAGGIKDVQLNTVVCASKVYDYDSGKITPSGYVARPTTFCCSPDILSIAQEMIRAEDHNESSHDIPLPPKIVFGAIASGDKVIASTSTPLYKRIKLHFNDSLALEMESAGFTQALQAYPLIKFTSIRGISDLLDGKTEADKNGSQTSAAKEAAAFLFRLLHYLNSNQLNLPIMDIQALAAEVFEKLWPIIENKSTTHKLSPQQVRLREIVNQLIPETFAEAEAHPKEEDLPSAFRHSLKRALKDREVIQQELESLLKKLEHEEPQQSFSIKDSKNIISGSTIQVGGNFHLGDS